MFHPDDIHPLTEFQRNAKSFIARVRKTGRPVLLTINGRAGAVLQSPEAFRDQALDRDDVLLLRSIDEALAGKGRPLREAAKDLARPRAKRRPRVA